MQVDLHDHLRNPRVIQASRVVVYDKNRNPIAVAVELTDGTVIASTLGCPDFQHVCREVGVYQTVILQDVAIRPPAFL